MELRRSDDPPAAPPAEDNVRYYSGEDGALRSLLADGTDEPVAGAGVLPNPTDEGDVLTVVEGEWAGAAGGGSMPGTEVFSGNNTLIADGVTGNPTVDNYFEGPNLLDITNPAAPVFVNAGLHIVTAFFSGRSMTDGGFFQAEVLMGDGFPAASGMSPVTKAPNLSDPDITLTLAAVVAAGDPLTLQVHNFDGVAARNFVMGTLTIAKV